MRAVFIAPGLAISPLAEVLILSAARAQHVADVIEPALARGAIVLCDRYADATLAYQGYGRGLDRAMLGSIASYATGGRVPDLTLLVDIDADVSHARVARRADCSGTAIDRLEREDARFHERVRDGYLALARGDARFVVLDGELAPHDLRDLALQEVIDRNRHLR
ncbi:MAG: hypothetical protein NVS2B3_00540 [Vulcanimicrobiaceae bacterium]